MNCTNRIICDGTAKYLEDNGCTILDRNWDCAMGHVDLICLEGDEVVLVFVDVRARPNEAARQRIVDNCRRIALFYMAMHPDVDIVRADIIVVTSDDIDWRTVDWYPA